MLVTECILLRQLLPRALQQPHLLLPQLLQRAPLVPRNELAPLLLAPPFTLSQLLMAMTSLHATSPASGIIPFQTWNPCSRGGSEEKKSGAAASVSSASSRGLGFTGPCIGIDYSPSVIQHLQSMYPQHLHPKFHFICADACYLIEDPPSAAAAGKGKGKKRAADADTPSFVPPALSAADKQRGSLPSYTRTLLDFLLQAACFSWPR
jgi:hypothetical protein